jgi:hypothetical protein
MSQADEILADDPVLRVLHERHPEVDLVILPPVSQPPADEPRLTLGEARRLQEVVETVLGDLGARLGPFALEPTISWRQSSQSLRHQVTGRALLAARQPTATMRRLGDTLLNLGWVAGPVAGPTPRLQARRDGVRLAVTAQAGGVRILAESEPRALAAEAAAEVLA